MSKQKRVVITGMGVLAPNGKTLDEFWQANEKGISGIGRLTRFDDKLVKVNIAGEVKEFDPEAYMLPAVYRKIDRFAQFGVAAAKMAIEAAGINFENSTGEKTGVIIGTGLGGEVTVAATKKKEPKAA